MCSHLLQSVPKMAQQPDVNNSESSGALSCASNSTHYSRVCNKSLDLE